MARRNLAWLVATLTLALAGGWLGALRPTTGGAPVNAAPSLQRGQPSLCLGEVTGTLSTGAIDLCEKAAVTLTVEPMCPVCPGGIRVVFV